MTRRHIKSFGNSKFNKVIDVPLCFLEYCYIYFFLLLLLENSVFELRINLHPNNQVLKLMRESDSKKPAIFAMSNPTMNGLFSEGS